MQVQMIDKILMNEVTVPDKDCALLLSGGVDSISVGFCAERLGKKVHAYSFRLDTNPSYDFLKAKEVAELFNWSFTGVKGPTKNLVEDWYRLVKLGCKKKVHFETVYPFLYIYPEIKQKYVLSGLGADGHYGLTKKAALHYKETKELFHWWKADHWKPEGRAGYLWHKNIADVYDKVFITPYTAKSVHDFFEGMSWYDVNKPFEKHHVRNAFDEFQKIKVKKHINLQSGDVGIIPLFETLLDNKEINFKNRSRMMDVSRDWYKLNQSNATLENLF
jgi:asparagine synthetase B (glutamine-hydrolysing)